MKKILIIEDDQVLRSQLAQILWFEGFEALEAENGKRGLARAIEVLPDLIICDIMMPELDGFGVIQGLRGNPRTAMIPFIFLTALIASPDRRHGMAEGADDYITKPYELSALIGSVRRRLEKRDRQIEEGRQRAEEVSLSVAALVPHEILETLEHITRVTSMLVLKYSAEDRQVVAMHQAVAEETLRLQRIMRRLHIYGQLPQLYARRFELVKTGSPTPTEGVIERVTREVCRRWNREADLTLVIDPGQLPLSEDYVVLLVEELVDNACKFSDSGTPIDVAGRGSRECWSLVVKNTGAGMTADQIARIGAFKQFWSGEKKPRGLGLGLALTQGIARLHGCEFFIQSNETSTSAAVLVPLEH